MQWFYNYEAAKSGKAGLHAELKSGNHSDGFLNFREASQYLNIRYLMAMLLAKKFLSLGMRTPDFVAGIPDAATGLGEDFADVLGMKLARMEKTEDKQIRIVSNLSDESTLLLVEDVCTKGTGYAEAVRNILLNYPETKILPVEMVVFSRGGLKVIPVDGINYQVVPLAERRINDWKPEECPLCRDFGSSAIKPKPKDQPGNWSLLVNSQTA